MQSTFLSVEKVSAFCPAGKLEDGKGKRGKGKGERGKGNRGLETTPTGKSWSGDHSYREIVVWRPLLRGIAGGDCFYGFIPSIMKFYILDFLEGNSDG